MSELVGRLREIVAAIAASDPGCKRFGAAQHRYERMPPLTRALDLDVADDYRDYVMQLSRGGIGPYYGLVPADAAAEHLVAAPRGVTAWERALPIAHLGCGYAALMPIDGAAAGQIWLDARQLSLVQPIRASFTAFYLDWIDRVANNQWLESFVPANACAITAALSGYLGVVEQRRGLTPGSLDGAALRDALADLGPGAIAAAADGDLALFADGDLLDPCVQCARTLQGLTEIHGLSPAVLQPGVAPIPSRHRTVTPAG